MFDFIGRLVRLRWFLALAALLGFCWGFKASAALPDWDCVVNTVPSDWNKKHCDQGLAYSWAFAHVEWRRERETNPRYTWSVVLVSPGSPFDGGFTVVRSDSYFTPPAIGHFGTAQFQGFCSSRPDLPGWTAPPGSDGKACFEGCEYLSSINIGGPPGTPLTTMFPTGQICGVGAEMIPGGTIPEDPEEPEEPGDPDDPDDPDDPNVPGNGSGDGFFPGNGGTPGEGGGWDPGSGSSGGEGQLCGGPNQVPCTMTLGTSTLPTSCEAPPTCTGDAVACGILFTTWRTACNAVDQPEWTKVQGDGTEGAGEDPEGPLRTLAFDPAGRLDQSGFGGGGSCPSLGTINFKVGTLARSINFDSLGWWCDMLGWVRGFMYLLGAFVGLGILIGGKG